MSNYAALANRLMLSSGRRSHDGGVNYVRRTDQSSKQLARNNILRLFSRRVWPDSLSILTMPGVDWSFERALISQRENRSGQLRPHRTFITAVEQSTAVWHAGVLTMPGGQTTLSSLIPPPFAKHAVRSLAIPRYYHCTFEQYVHGLDDSDSDYGFGGAWIDLTGPLTVARLDALESLWRRVKGHLIVTSLRARWTADMAAMLREAGGITPLLLSRLDGSIPLSSVVYNDTSPMHQAALTRLHPNLAGAS